jgi:hypothetical protein
MLILSQKSRNSGNIGRKRGGATGISRKITYIFLGLSGAKFRGGFIFYLKKTILSHSSEVVGS